MDRNSLFAQQSCDQQSEPDSLQQKTAGSTYSESLRLLLQQFGAYRPIKSDVSVNRHPPNSWRIWYLALTLQVEMSTSLARHLSIALDFASLAFITGNPPGDRQHHATPAYCPLVYMPSPYHAMEIYRFRLVRVCVPLVWSAFLLELLVSSVDSCCPVSV